MLPHKITWTNKNNDVLQQEIYQGHCQIKRDNSLFNRSTSSLSIKPLKVNIASERSFDVLATAGETVRIIGYCRCDSAFYNGGTWSAPTVTIAGLGATPVVYTATSAINGAWDKFDLSITNASGVDGSFTVTYSVLATTVLTGTVYFDGVTDAPFITKARHYGFVIDETNPKRTINQYSVASEATAGAYTGITITGAAKEIEFASGTANSMQKFYDYSQYWAVTNLSYDVPFVRSGDIFTLATGWKAIDPYFSGDIVWSGIVEYTAIGTKSDNINGGIITVSAAGAYVFDGVLSSTIELINTSGSPVTIELPAGTSNTNTGPNITVSYTTISASASITNLVAGSRVRIYNQTTATEIYNAIVAGTSYSASYIDGTDYSSGDTVSVRIAYTSGVTAKIPVEYFAAVDVNGWSVLASQQNDTVYNFNAIDGSTCTEFTADFPNVQIDVDDPDGYTTPQRAYAWYIYNQMTDDGLRYYHGAITAEDELNYRVNVSIADMHGQNVNTDPLYVQSARIYRSDGTPMFVPGSGPVQQEYGRVYGLETGVSGLTPTESAKLLAIPSNPILTTDDRIDEVYAILGLDSTKPVTTNNTSITFTGVNVGITQAGDDVTLTRV
jgi:hypothetical protein